MRMLETSESEPSTSCRRWSAPQIHRALLEDASKASEELIPSLDRRLRPCSHCSRHWMEIGSNPAVKIGDAIQQMFSYIYTKQSSPPTHLSSLQRFWSNPRSRLPHAQATGHCTYVQHYYIDLVVVQDIYSYSFLLRLRIPEISAGSLPAWK
jgi:hypothetical protein